MNTIMNKILILLILLCATIFIGCYMTYTGEIRSDISPTSMVAKKYPTKVGVYFTPRLLQYEEVYAPSHTFKFKMGMAMKEALTKSIQAAYSKVSVISEPARPEQFERIISFDLQSSNVRYEVVNPNFWGGTGKANAVIHVVMEIINGSSLETIRRIAVNGNGFSTEEPRKGDIVHGRITGAIEDAIRQLADNTANLLISGVAEPQGK
jgi:hypothetical protein